MDQTQQQQLAGLAAIIGPFLGLVVLQAVVTIVKTAWGLLTAWHKRNEKSPLVEIKEAVVAGNEGLQIALRETAKKTQSSLESNLSIKDQLISGLEARVEQLESALADQRKVFDLAQTAHESAIGRLDGELELVNTKLKARDETIAARDETIAAQKESSTLARAADVEQIRRLQERVDTVEHQLQDMTAANIDLVKRIDAITEERDIAQQRAATAEARVPPGASPTPEAPAPPAVPSTVGKPPSTAAPEVAPAAEPASAALAGPDDSKKPEPPKDEQP